LLSNVIYVREGRSTEEKRDPKILLMTRIRVEMIPKLHQKYQR
jgi:hypothetical protein